MSKSVDPKLIVVSFRLTPDERRRLDELRADRSISDFIREKILR